MGGRRSLCALFLLTVSGVGCETCHGRAVEGESDVALTHARSDSEMKEAFESIKISFAGASTAFFSEPVKVSLWVHGGDPGEGNTSDLLLLEALPGQKPRAEYTRARFDLDYDPPYLAERFSVEVSTGEVAALIQDVLSAPLFETAYASETAPPVGDLFKETWELSRGESAVSKTFYEEFPPELEPLRARLTARMEALAKASSPEVLNKKRR